MIMSRSADYALRAMVYLARRRGPYFIPLSQIAVETRTPHFLLARLMQHLVRANLVQSMKGHHGGFRLVLDPSEISAAAVIHAVSGPLKVFDPTTEYVQGGFGRLLDMFGHAARAIQQVFESASLEQLARTTPDDAVENRRIRFGNGSGKQFGSIAAPASLER